MKTSTDPRHLRRRKLVKKIYSHFFSKQEVDNPIEEGILKKQKEIDKLIQKAAPEWPVEKINKVDLAILRLAVFELRFVQKEPQKVIIDEAIELAKEYGSDASPAFINGTLGSLLRSNPKSK